ncbi:Crp/Fnr family transcriptional regulator [Dichotomicrobium thermohalophilum]|nr:Crp/Fnr family transcriptional regulator [Dichotomicrobium thermohalophilum]
MAVVAWGSAYRYRMLADGRRVVFDVLLPGDLIELATPAMESDLAAAASNKLDLVFVREAQLKRLSEANPEFGKAIAMTTQADSLRLMAHVMRLSRLTAYERVAHFLLEIHDRLNVIGLAPNGRFQMPINQIVLSDALGMTRFHVNRTLRRLRTDGWVELNQQVVHLRDAEALADLCEYKRWHPVA